MCQKYTRYLRAVQLINGVIPFLFWVQDSKEIVSPLPARRCQILRTRPRSVASVF
jgi:hypothetical protein